MKRITIEDVAQVAGVSRQTVSRAMNDKDEINLETKKRVLQTIQALGYKPNRLAQGMVTQRTFTVGLVVGNITNPFFPEVTRGVQDLAQSNGFNVFLCNTDDKAEVELQELRSLAAQRVDGIILFAHNVSDEVLSDFANSYRPVVLINRAFNHPNINVLMVANYRGAQLVADYFLDSGHTTFGMLTNNSPTYRSSRRVIGFESRLRERGHLLPEDHIVPATGDLGGGYQAAHQLLNAHPEVTAIFAYNDLLALGAMRACTERKLRIPQDVAIIGFDDIQFATMSTPALSTVQVDKYAIGEMAMRRLLDMIEKPEQLFPAIDIDVSLILRETT